MNAVRPKISIIIGILLFSTLLGSISVAGADQTKTLSTSSLGLSADPIGSWSPLVPCSSPIPIVRITDITDNMTQMSSYNNSPFSPGITLPTGFIDNAADGGAKRWLTSGDSTTHPPSGWVSPGPSCAITNLKGQIAASFVEIDGVMRTSFLGGDCNDYNNTNSFDPINGGGPMGGKYCDTTFNVYDPSIVSNPTLCSNSTVPVPACYGIIHVEIDHDWKAAGYCPSTSKGWSCNANLLNSSTTTSTLLDIQGFVYWDTNHTSNGVQDCAMCQPQHSFSGWEIHPLTAWRIHQSTSTVTALSCSPGSTSIGSSLICIASVTGNNPTGTVSFTTTDTNAKLNPSCTLSAASCQISYTSSTLGTANITATYSGDGNNIGSSGKFALAVGKANSSVSIACAPNPVPTGTATTCSAAVSGYSPTGTVSWQSSVSGTFSSNNCNLSSGSCSVQFTATSRASPVTINASYSGNIMNLASSDAFPLNVKYNIPTPNVTVSCSPSSVRVGSPTNCTVTIAGDSPTGTVNFSSTDAGAKFSPSSSCTLSSSASCQVTYTPSAAGSPKITASYSGDANNLPGSNSYGLTVQPLTTSTNQSSVSMYLIIGALVVAVVIVGASLFLRRRS